MAHRNRGLQHAIDLRQFLTADVPECLQPRCGLPLARELGVETAVLDPIEGLAEGSKDDYITLMRANLDALRKANQCS